MFDVLLPRVYDELRKLAQAQLRRERADHTLNATGLVHEAYLRLVDQRVMNWENRAHFFGAASNAMRRILVDYARSKSAKKRKGQRVSLTNVGQGEQAIETSFETAGGSASLNWMKEDPYFDPLRGLPRYQALVEKLES